MKTDLELITKDIQKKLGKENSALITDDIANIITIKSNYEKELQNNKETIEDLKKSKETLIEANGNLLQQISMGAEIKEEKKEDKEDKIDYKNFNFSAMFDEKGNFIR